MENEEMVFNGVTFVNQNVKYGTEKSLLAMLVFCQQIHK